MAYPGIWQRLLNLIGIVNGARVNVSSPITGGGSITANPTIGINASSETVVGAVQLATTSEALAGSLRTKAVTPAGLGAHNSSAAAHPNLLSSINANISSINSTLSSHTASISSLQSSVSNLNSRVSALESGSGGNPDPGGGGGNPTPVPSTANMVMGHFSASNFVIPSPGPNAVYYWHGTFTHDGGSEDVQIRQAYGSSQVASYNGWDGEGHYWAFSRG